MSFNEIRLDECVAYGFTVTPGYDTGIVELENGKEVRNVRRTRAKRRFSALYQNFTPQEFEELLAAFHACAGSAYAFRFKDWTDYQVTNGALGTTPGANQTPVQLVKVYSFGSLSRTRTITKPVAGTITVYQDDGAGNFVAKPGTTDTTTGLFTPTTNWAAGRALRGTFQYDVGVRFASDEMPSSYDDISAITSTCELIEDLL